MTSRRTLSFTRVWVSRRMVSSSSPMRPVTSSGSRDQFSVEKEYSVRNATPRSRAARRVLRMVSTPARWPASAGRWRDRAHLRFPSMTMAMWRGTVRLDLEDLFLFCLPDLVGHQHVAVGELLQRRLGALDLV